MEKCQEGNTEIHGGKKPYTQIPNKETNLKSSFGGFRRS